MNVLDLQNLGVEEMNEMEVIDVEGGFSNGAFEAGRSVGGYAGRFAGALALLAFCFM